MDRPEKKGLWCALVLALLPVNAIAAGSQAGRDVHLWTVLPFALLLLSIAILPLTHKDWWERQYPVVAFVLGLAVVIYYVVAAHNGARMLHTLVEYFSFISLLTALFVISGGIHIRIAGRSTPLGNTVLLGIGAVLANVLGTTGASMLLIRPYLRMNKDRIRPYHVVFFIFIVSNMGGALTPIGDPPLFLGYLKGIPFFWVIGKVWGIWAPVMAVLLGLFFGMDWWSARQSGRNPEPTAKGRITLEGSQNFLFLFLIVGAVLAQGAGVMQRYPPEIVTLASASIMLAITALAYRLTQPRLRAENEFHFGPICEVAILFAGIFATMTPALDYLEVNGAKLGLDSVGHFYWGTGTLSAVLDNAPTYLNSLAAAFGLHGLSIENPGHTHALLETAWRYVQAISVSAVFFGAMTYIGNGPNFMVRSIAEHAGVRCPSFFGYVFKYSVPILLPLFFLVYWVWFRA